MALRRRCAGDLRLTSRKATESDLNRLTTTSTPAARVSAPSSPRVNVPVPAGLVASEFS